MNSLEPIKGVYVLYLRKKIKVKDKIRLFPVGQIGELPEHGIVNVLFIQLMWD